MYTARVHLFKSITYHVEAEIHCGVHQTPPPLHDLLDFLVATPSVCLHIRELYLAMNIPEDILLQLLSLRVASALRGGELSVLYAILQHTPGLRSLTVHDFRFADPGTTLTLPPIPDGPALQHLESLCIRQYKLFPEIGRKEHTSQLFYMLGSIGRLSFTSRFVRNKRFVDAVPSWPPGALKHVRELSTKHVRDLRHLRMVDCARLEACHLWYADAPADVAWLANWLRTAGKGLRALGISVRVHQRMLSAEPDRDVLDLSVLSRLEALSLVLTLFVDVAQGIFGFVRPVYAFLCRALSETADSLRIVTFRLEVRDILNRPTMEDNDTAFDIRQALVTDWQELDGTFIMRATTAQLRAVRFVEEMVEEWAAVRRAITSALPRACARGLVQWAEPCEAHGTF